MQVRLLKSVKDDTGWHKPGAVVEVSKEEADFLLKKKAAVVVEEIKVEEPKIDTDGPVAEDENLVESLVSDLGVSEGIATALITAGFDSVQKIADAKQPHLVKVKGISGKTAVKLIESAQTIIEERNN